MDSRRQQSTATADEGRTSHREPAQMNTVRHREPRAPKSQRQKATACERPQRALFHDQVSLEMGRRSVRDSTSLDPRNVLSRLTHSVSQPNLRDPIQDDLLTLRPRSLDTRPSDYSPPCPTPDKRDQRNPRKFDGHTFTLDHFSALFALETLIERHGRISHMGILDPSYSFFISQARDAALYYKVLNKVAVVGGDPLCEQEQWPTLFEEFARFRKKKSLGIAYLGATPQFAKYASAQKGWVSWRWGTERALNPMTNSVLLEKQGKRIITQNKQLLDPRRGNMKIDIYVPAQKRDPELQEQLMHVYETWRRGRNESGKPQAYITIFDPFALPQLMVYIYSSGPDGKPNGFAALRRTDATYGYHIDPYCALPDAPKGTSDLLIYAALALLHRAGVPYLGLGFEPATELTEVHGLSAPMTAIITTAYRRLFSRLPIQGKKAFHDKWHPDENLDAGLYLIYPSGRPDLHHSLATMHFANISARDILKGEIKDQLKKLSLGLKKSSDPEIKEVAKTLAKPETKQQSSEHKVPETVEKNLPPHSIHTGIFTASKVSLHIGIATIRGP